MKNTTLAIAPAPRPRTVLLHQASPGRDNDAVARSSQKTYRWARLPWIPHYTRRGMFVAPGGAVMEGAALLAAGAIEVPAVLWTRAYNQRR